MAIEKPKTIAELQAFAAAHNLPLDKMRFFLGVDTHEAKAFGIYQDARGNFVVYKNKADGTRAVRYEGPDEAHAVGEIFEKMRDEIAKQPAHQAKVAARREAAAAKSGEVPRFSLDEEPDLGPAGDSVPATDAWRGGGSIPTGSGWHGNSFTSAGITHRDDADDADGPSTARTTTSRDSSPRRRSKRWSLGHLGDVVGTVQRVMAILLGFTLLTGLVQAIPSCGKKIHRGARGYYHYENTVYYYLDDDWYSWNGYAWYYDTPPDEFFEDEDWQDEYYDGSSYDSSYGVTDFTSTTYYDDYLESLNNDSSSGYGSSSSWDDDDHSSSWDDDDDWDWDSSDDWDSSTTDWDDDW